MEAAQQQLRQEAQLLQRLRGFLRIQGFPLRKWKYISFRVELHTENQLLYKTFWSRAYYILPISSTTAGAAVVVVVVVTATIIIYSVMVNINQREFWLFILLQDLQHRLYYLFLFGSIFLHSHHHQRCKVRPSKECKSGVNKGMQRLCNSSQRYISRYMLRQFRHRYQLHWLSCW